mmetsp:Transcript_24469/g.56754  ORF Transcript_24469/g.56754 Transcript_24469/m.56754 type:complete len:249 (+) Transcript_24469:375-1121(+)
MPSLMARALSHSSCNSWTFASSTAFSSATCCSISRRFCAIASSKAACSRIIWSSLVVKSEISKSFSSLSRFHSSTEALNEPTVSCVCFNRFSKMSLSLERLLARMSKPAGPSSRMVNLCSKARSSCSNSSSLSSGASVSGRGGTNFAFRVASLSWSLKVLFCLFNFPHSSETARKSASTFVSRTCAFAFSRMFSSRWRTARPSLSTRSATSLTLFLISPDPRACKPFCSRRTSWMCALRISVIICIAS